MSAAAGLPWESQPPWLSLSSIMMSRSNTCACRKAVYLAAAKEECSCVSRKHVCEGSLLLHLVDSKGGRCYGLGLSHP